MEPSELLGALDRDWSIRIEKDIRLPALVSLLKAAHLTLFHRLGYRYGLSASGFFLGHDILGDFFETNRELPRTEQLLNARPHFLQFVNLVRPILEVPEGIKGTLTDGKMYFCTVGGRPWGMMVFLRTGAHFHAVIVPRLESADDAATLVAFLEEPFPMVTVRLARDAGKHFEVAPDDRQIRWPEANFAL